VEVPSLTFSQALGNMKYDSHASLLPRTFASPCLSCKPKARVMTDVVRKGILMDLQQNWVAKRRISRTIY
jgi:hypothetical protein